MIINGKEISEKVLKELESNPAKRPVHIVAISISSEHAIKSFIDMKKKYAERLGMTLEHIEFQPGIPESNVMAKIAELSSDPNITGIIVEIPLASGYDQEKILNAVPVSKDIDVLSEEALENFYNDTSKISPPAVEAFSILVKELNIELYGKTAAVFGQSILIGAPISHFLESCGCKVYKIDENTQNPEEFSKQADIIVSGVGKPNLIKGEMVKEGAIVIDYGFEKVDGKTVGDVEFTSVSPKASLITPVPGGIGPLVIVAFLKNACALSSI